MKRYGFNIIATWETRINNRTEFVYLLSWPDEQSMLRAWEKFRGDEEWKRIKKETTTRHGELLGEIQDRVLITTPDGPETVQPTGL